MPLSRERKEEYFVKMKEFLAAFTKCFVVQVDNVGSKQLQAIRQALRGRAEILMGKNTMMRKVFADVLAEQGEDNCPLAVLANMCKGNVGFVFTNGDLGTIKKVIDLEVRPAPARVGSIAPIDVIVPKGPTGCDPGQTAFFQTLQISTKITKGQIEMTTDTHLVSQGERVGASQAALLKKLDINPFTYGLVVCNVYDNGNVYDTAILDITPETLAVYFGEAIKVLAAISLASGIPTAASVPHSLANAFKAVLAITCGLPGFTFPKAAAFKALVPIEGAAAPAAE
jgi:large subunit ribosomal protein LP0